MSIDFILGQLAFIRDRLSQSSPLTGEETQRLTGIFQRITACSLPDQDRVAILDLQGRVIQSPQTADLQRIFLLLLKNCPDATIAYFLGLNTWQSEGDIIEAKRLIIECVRGMENELDLSRLRLSSLPSGIGHLTQLKCLRCVCNKLTLLPASIGQLSRLETLNCCLNNLTSLPASIGQLSRLERLDCSSNELTSLPASIGQLSRLERLDCSSNELTSLPASIGQLSRLGTLNCECNELRSLPAEIGQLGELRSLNCTHNQLTSLPAEIGQLGELQWINCSKNQLRSLPVEIGQLGELDWLDCSKNQFRSLPLTLASFTEIELDFADNEISTVPVELSHLTINLERQRVSQQPNARLQATSFASLQGAVSEQRQDLKKLEIPKLQKSLAWPMTSLWLDKLMGSVDFKNAGTRSMTAERVLSILKLAEENEEYCAAMNAILTQALSTCVDRATLPLCSLEIQKAIIECKAGSLDLLLKVLKSAFASELIEKHAIQFVKNHTNPAVKREELEVHLGFQVKLKQEFNLPIGIQDVNYFFCSHIKGADLVVAKAQVHEALRNGENFIAFLVQQTAWTDKLTNDFPSEKQLALVPVDVEFGQLEDQLFAGTLTDQAYKTASEGLVKKFDAATKGWLKVKTEELCLNPFNLPNLFETVITVKCKDLPSNQALFIRGNCAGLNWNQGIKLTPVDWETFQFITNVPFTGELDYKLLIDDSKWETGDNHKVTQGETVDLVHSFNVAILPPIKKTVMELEFCVPPGKTLFLAGTGPLGNWDRKVPMRCLGNENNSWFFSFDGQFPDFKYKLLLDDKWEQGENRDARCGDKASLKAPRF